MTKAKISEYDATAANNTDANGVNIAEGCAPSGINNAIREVMAALKRFETGSDGDSVTVGGNLVVSGTATISNTATLGNVDINGGAIDGATIGGATAAAVTATTMAATVVQSDTINEKTSAAGVTIDSVLLKDNKVTANELTINSNNISAENSLGFRNRIINGDMRIDQRNAGASVTPTNAQYTLDRYQSILSAASKYSIQQVSDAPTGFVNSLRVTSSSAYAVPADEVFQIRQSIEGTNCSDLAFGSASAKTVTLSFWVRSSLTGTFGGRIQNSAADRNYPFSYTISAANTWEYKTVTIAGDTTGTWLTTTGIGIQIRWSLGSGSNLQGTAGSWTASNISSVTGETQVVATNGATWYITGVQLEVGSVATPFERRPFGTELQLCQRYFEKSYELAVSLGQSTNTSKGSFVTGAAANTFWRWSQNFRVSKRTAPTFTIYSTTGASGNVRLNNASDLAVTTEDAGENAASIYVSRNASTGDFFWWQWAASAEL